MQIHAEIQQSWTQSYRHMNPEKDCKHTHVHTYVGILYLCPHPNRKQGDINIKDAIIWLCGWTVWGTQTHIRDPTEMFLSQCTAATQHKLNSTVSTAWTGGFLYSFIYILVFLADWLQIWSSKINWQKLAWERRTITVCHLELLCELSWWDGSVRPVPQCAWFDSTFMCYINAHHYYLCTLHTFFRLHTVNLHTFLCQYFAHSCTNCTALSF